MAKRDTMDRVARYWNTIAEDFDSIYTGRNKSAFGRALDHVFRADIYGRFDWVMQNSGDLAGRSVCDIGCGSGRFVVEFAKRGAGHVTGVDVAPEMIRLAEELAAKDRVADRCDFAVSDVLNWTPTRKFDVTIAIGFWDYIADPRERLRLIRRFTTGRFLSAWPRFWTWRMPVRKVRLEYILGCPVYFFRKPQVYRMLEEAGFRVERCDVVGKLFCVDARPR
jgi:SAM-dependent methyltransferase